MSIEERMSQLEYYMELLLTAADMSRYPYYALLIRQRVSKEEAEEIERICAELSEEMDKQKHKATSCLTISLRSLRDS